MRGFVRLGGTGHRSGGVPGAIAPQISISGWARPRTPGQVERGLERLAWLGCGRQPGSECAFEARWQATRASLRRPAIVALDMGRHIFDASTRLDDPDPLQQPGVVLLDRPDVWCEAGRRSGHGATSRPRHDPPF